MLDEIAGNLMVHLCEMTGTKNFQNYRDIPVIFKYVGRLSCVNKAIYNATNSYTATHLFLTAIKNRFQMPEEHLAAQWNTRGARVWLWNYIEHDNYFEIYERILLKGDSPSFPGPRSPQLRDRMMEMCIRKVNGKDPVEKRPRVVSPKTLYTYRCFNSIHEVQPWWITHTNKESRRYFSEKENILWDLITRCVEDLLYKTEGDWKGPKWHSSGLGICSLRSIMAITEKSKEVISLLTQGWAAARLADNPNVGSRESEEEWGLYIKKDGILWSHVRIINTLLPLLGLEDVAHCNDQWLHGQSDLQHPLYLWIRKDRFDLVRNSLNLRT